MVDNEETLVPVWTLATHDVKVPAILGGASMTPQRLGELRTALAALAETPIATLEVHPAPENFERSRGFPLHSTSPLAQHLSQLITATSKSSPAVSIGAGGEALYRLVAPAKLAAQLGSGLIKPMTSRAVSGGVRGALLSSSGIVGQASFVPVAGNGVVVGAPGGSAAAAGAAAAGASTLTIAAPLVLMAVAVGVSARADLQRQKAMERITDLLEKVHADRLDDERSQLDGCRSAIDKATAILLDKGRIGAALGLDSAVFAIETAMASAKRRLQRWQRGLDNFPDGPVQLGVVRKAFPGIDQPAGEFQGHLELAALAIALKRRVLVLQAVEHAQMEPGNPFEQFVHALQADQKEVDELDGGIAMLLRRLSTLQLDRTHGIRDFVFSAAEVDELLRASRMLRDLGDGIDLGDRRSDVVIEMARSPDGSLTVFPASVA